MKIFIYTKECYGIDEGYKVIVREASDDERQIVKQAIKDNPRAVENLRYETEEFRIGWLPKNKNREYPFVFVFNGDIYEFGRTVIRSTPKVVLKPDYGEGVPLNKKEVLSHMSGKTREFWEKRLNDNENILEDPIEETYDSRRPSDLLK